MGRIAGWNKKNREAFLDHLAGSCNVKASAALAGIPAGSVYQARRRDPEFAEEWRVALLAGYDLIETHLVGRVLAGSERDEAIDTAIGPIDVDTALRLLSAHRNALRGKWRGGPALQRATREATDKAILRKLAAMDASAGGTGEAAPADGAGEAEGDAAADHG